MQEGKLRGTIRWLVVVCWLLAACGSPTAIPARPTPAPTVIPPTPAPAADPFFASQGGGEPRTGGYWLVWNSCAEDNRADVAEANGGREAGWIILDDLLANPGILVGDQPVETCEQGMRLLQVQDLRGGDRGGDPVYQLAAQLLVAQLNLAAGGEYCPAVDQAVRAGQLLLLSMEFVGSGDYALGKEDSGDRVLALSLTSQLDDYNVGELCR